MAKAGIVEALYIGELIGLLFIWAGFPGLRASAAAPSSECQPRQSERRPGQIQSARSTLNRIDPRRTDRRNQNSEGRSSRPAPPT